MSKRDKNSEIKDICKNFRFDGTYVGYEAIGSGHINDTYLVTFLDTKGTKSKYTLQRINNYVFKDPEKLMENIVNVTSHIRKKIGDEGGDVLREVLTVISTYEDKSFYLDPAGNYWRAYIYIDGARAYQESSDPIYFYESAKSFGKFQRQLADFPADKLHETIVDFHNTPARLARIEEAIDNNLAGRSDKVQEEINFALNRREDTRILTDLLAEEKLPLRVTHNDTKLNNVLIDDASQKGICVIDLDTVMPGLIHYDFGDSIRFGASTAAEDEKDLSKVMCDLDLFETYTLGFLEGMGDALTPTEIKYLAFSAILLTLELGMRFLADYLDGDKYFKTAYSQHNLDRCKTQFKLVSDMEGKREQMEEIVYKTAEKLGLKI